MNALYVLFAVACIDSFGSADPSHHDRKQLVDFAGVTGSQDGCLQVDAAVDLNTFIQVKSSVLGFQSSRETVVLDDSPAVAGTPRASLPVLYVLIVGACLLLALLRGVTIRLMQMQGASSSKEGPSLEQSKQCVESGGQNLQDTTSSPTMDTSDVRSGIVAAWNDVPTGRMEQLMVDAPPHKVAVITAAGAQITYHELAQQSSHLAVHIWRTLSLSNDTKGSSCTVCGLCIEKSPEMLFGMLGILKAGAAYLPLPPTFPEQRLEFMAKDAKVRLVVTVLALTAKVKTFAAELPTIDVDIAVLKPVSESLHDGLRARASEFSSFDTFTVLYTSGSTGQPKGVELTHSAEITLAVDHARRWLTSDDKVLQQYPLQFDPHIQDIFPTFAAHATLVLGPCDPLDTQALDQVMRREGVTSACFVPSVFSVFAANFGVPRLRWLAFGGEAFPVKMWRDLQQDAQVSEVVNLYGPTEASVVTTIFGPEPNLDVVQKHGCVPIGKAAAWRECLVIDTETGQLIDRPGEFGELWIAGPGLAKGYLNQPELTASKFVQHPFRTSELAYRSGDLVQWLSSGDLLFSGRIDHQVKLHGLRIELGEIEEILRESEDVVHSSVVMHNSERLVAFLVPQTASVPAALAACKARLPPYMVPAAIVPLAEVPRIPGGKVDRKILAAWPLEDAGHEGSASAVFVAEDSLMQMRLQSVETVGVQNLLGVAAVLLCMDHWMPVSHQLALSPIGHSMFANAVKVARHFDHNICLACAAYIEATAQGLDGKRDAFRFTIREALIICLWLSILFPIPQILSAFTLLLTGGDYYTEFSHASSLMGMRWFLILLLAAKATCVICHAMRIPAVAQLFVFGLLRCIAVSWEWTWPFPLSWLATDCAGPSPLKTQTASNVTAITAPQFNGATCLIGWPPATYFLYLYFYVMVVHYAPPLFQWFKNSSASLRPVMRTAVNAGVATVALLMIITLYFVEDLLRRHPTVHDCCRLLLVPAFVLCMVAVVPIWTPFIFMGRHILCTYVLHLPLTAVWISSSPQGGQIHGLHAFVPYAMAQRQINFWLQSFGPVFQGGAAVLLFMIYAVVFCGVISPLVQLTVGCVWRTLSEITSLAWRQKQCRQCLSWFGE